MTTETPMTREVSHSDILEVMKIFFKGRREDDFWQMEHLEEHIRESFPVPVRVVDDAEAALLATMTELEQVKGERDALEADMSAGSFYKEADANWLVSRAEAAETALAAMTEREERLCRSLRHYMDLAHTGGTEADWFEAHDGATAALTQKGA